jgi:phosphate transport system ATP-binding protein
MPQTTQDIVIRTQNLSVNYGKKQVLFDVNLEIPFKTVVAFIGASGCGKSSLLRCFNRLNDTIEKCTIGGNIFVDDQDIYLPTHNVLDLRKKVGMVFQKPVVFPFSIFENVAYGVKLHKIHKNKADLANIVEESLQKTGLWDEVKDRLYEDADGLSGGQQQRLCIARTIAIKPEVILMDEPCSALDPVATAKVEALIKELKQQYAVMIVTHSMQQAARVSDKTVFINDGKIIEYDTTEKIFNNPDNSKTKDYITGKFG